MLQQVAPGKSGVHPSALTTVQYNAERYIIFLCQDGIVIYKALDFVFIQTIYLGQGNELGLLSDDPHDLHRNYPSAVSMCEISGKIAVACGKSVYLYKPVHAGETSNTCIRWTQDNILPHAHAVNCLEWSMKETLVTAGCEIALWSIDNGDVEVAESTCEQQRGKLSWACTWRHDLPVTAKLVKFSPDSEFIASVGENDSYVKIWFRQKRGKQTVWCFHFLKHPDVILDFAWRKVERQERPTSPACLYTRCADQLLRIFSCSNPIYPRMFFLVAQIDPVSSSTISLSPPPKTIHWIENEALTEAVGTSLARYRAVDAEKGTEFVKADGMAHLRTLVRDTPDLFMGVSEDGGVMMWGVQNLSSTHRQVPKVFFLLRMAQSLLPSDEQYFWGNCLIYCGLEERKRKSVDFPANLTIVAQSVRSGRSNAYSLSLTDFFDSKRTHSQVILRHSWCGHGARVKRIVNSSFDDALVVTLDATGAGIVWRREIPAVLEGRVREGFIEIGELKGRDEPAVAQGPMEVKADVDKVGGCHVVTFLSTGAHIVVYDGEAIHLHSLVPSVHTGFHHRTTTLPSFDQLSPYDRIVALHSFESEKLSALFPQSTSINQHERYPPFSSTSQMLDEQRDKSFSRSYHAIIAISDHGHIWTWVCMEKRKLFPPPFQSQRTFNVHLAAFSGHEVDDGSIRLVHHTSTAILSRDAGPHSFSFLLNFPTAAMCKLAMFTTDRATGEQSSDVFVCFSQLDRTLRSWALDWNALTRKGTPLDEMEGDLWIESAQGDCNDSGNSIVLKAGAMGKVALVVDEGRGFSVLEIWSKDPGSKEFEQEHVLEFSPLSGLPTDVSWLLTSDSNQLLAVSFYDRVVVLYPVKQQSLFEDDTVNSPSSIVSECQRRSTGSLNGRRRHSSKRQSIGRRGSIVVVMDAAGRMRRDGGWKKMLEIVLNGLTPHPIGSISWARNGSLIIAAGFQLFCYNKWVIRGEDMIVSVNSKNSLPGGLVEQNKISPTSTIFNISHSVNSILPHHHPQLLVQYLLWGKIEVVKRILLYLFQFLSVLHNAPGSWSMDGLRIKIDELPSVPFGYFLGEEKITELRLPVTPPRQLSLFDKALSTGDLDDSLRHSSRDTFTATEASFLTERLTQISLPHITNVEQLFLIAIIDTVVQVERQKRSLDENGVRYLLFARLYSYLVRSSPVQSRPSGLASRDMAWAFHSESQDILLEACSSLTGGSLIWKEAKAMGIALWIRSTETLRQQLETIARNQYTMKDPRDPVDASIFFFALRKRKLLHGLWKTATGHPEQAAMVKFLSHDFSEDRWKQAARKNAFALLGKQRYEYAAAFFLLGDSLHDAVSVCLRNLHDFQLAIAIARAYEGDDGPILLNILRNHLIPKAVDDGDRWMASMVFSMLKERDRAIQATMIPLKTFHCDTPATSETHSSPTQVKKKEETDPALLVLFGFLCRHTNGMRHRGTYKVDPEDEEEFVIRSVIAYERFCCPMLALIVLETWVVERPPPVDARTTFLSRKDLKRRNTIETGALDWDWDAQSTERFGPSRTDDERSHPLLEDLSSDRKNGSTAMLSVKIGKDVPDSLKPTSHRAEELFSDEESPPKKISLFEDDAPSSVLLQEDVDYGRVSRAEFTDDPKSDLGSPLDLPLEATPCSPQPNLFSSKPIGAKLRLYKVSLGMQLLQHVLSAVYVEMANSKLMRDDTFFADYLGQINQGLCRLSQCVGVDLSVIDQLLISRCFETDSYAICFRLLTQGILSSTPSPDQFISFLLDGSNNIAYLIFRHTSISPPSMLIQDLSALAQCILSTFTDWYLIVHAGLSQHQSRFAVLRIVILCFVTYIVALTDQRQFDRLALCVLHCRSFFEACECESQLSSKLPAMLDTLLKGEITFPTEPTTDDGEAALSDEQDEKEESLHESSTAAESSVAEQIVAMVSLSYVANSIATFLHKSGNAISDDLACCVRTSLLEPLSNKQWLMEDDIKRSPHSSLLKGTLWKHLHSRKARICWSILKNIKSTPSGSEQQPDSNVSESIDPLKTYIEPSTLWVRLFGRQ